MTSRAAKLALVLIGVALATGAHAGGDLSSLLSCGVNLGSKSPAHKPSPPEKTEKDNRMNHILGAVTPQPVNSTAAEQATGDDQEFRLPTKVTVATIGCAW